MPEDNIAIRLKFLIDRLGIPSSQFADSCRIPRPTFSQILNGRNKKISDQIIRQIHEAYPNISISWLLFNEGAMLLDQSINLENSTSESETDSSSHSDNNDSLYSNSELDNENSENPSFEKATKPSVYSEENKYSKENALNSPSKEREHTIKEEVKSILKNAEILSEIAKNGPKCRKVVSVTVYYDDSTFETFRPV